MSALSPQMIKLDINNRKTTGKSPNMKIEQHNTNTIWVKKKKNEMKQLFKILGMQ